MKTVGRASASALAVAFLLVVSTNAFSQPLFEDVAQDLGIMDVIANACDVYWYDYDNDQDLDLIVAHRYGSTTYLYRNDGAQFTRLDHIGLPENWDGGIGGAMDFDHDGDLDLYTRCYHSPSTLLVYQNGVFTDYTSELGLPYEAGTRGCRWVDFDRDGWMDLLWGSDYTGFHLYRNYNGIAFTDITSVSQLPSLSSFSEICEADADLDGDIDLFMTRTNGDDHFFVNQGNGVFVDYTAPAGLNAACGKIDCRWVDIDHDKYPDILTQAVDRHTIWHNNGDNTFTEMTVHGTETDFSVAAPYGATYTIADFDMDGDYDFYAVRPGGCGSAPALNQLFIQDSINGTDVWFHDAAPDFGMNILSNGSSSTADIDGDGDLDLTVSNSSGQVFVFRNNTVSSNFLQVRVLGPNGEQDRWHTRIDLCPHGSPTVLRSSELNNSNVDRNGFNNYFVTDANSHYDLRIYFACGTVMTPEEYPYLADIVPSEINHKLTVYMGSPTATPDLPNPTVGEFRLNAAYPNPFNAMTTISYSVPKSGPARLAVYNIAGQLVRDLVNGTVTAGSHNVSYNAETQTSGIYFVRLEAGEQMATQKIVLLK